MRRTFSPACERFSRARVSGRRFARRARAPRRERARRRSDRELLPVDRLVDVECAMAKSTCNDGAGVLRRVYSRTHADATWRFPSQGVARWCSRGVRLRAAGCEAQQIREIVERFLRRAEAERGCFGARRVAMKVVLDHVTRSAVELVGGERDVAIRSSGPRLGDRELAVRGDAF